MIEAGNFLDVFNEIQKAEGQRIPVDPERIDRILLKIADIDPNLIITNYYFTSRGENKGHGFLYQGRSIHTTFPEEGVDGSVVIIDPENELEDKEA